MEIDFHCLEVPEEYGGGGFDNGSSQLFMKN